MKNRSIVQMSRGSDYWLIAATVILLIIGAIMIYSTTAAFRPDKGPWYILVQHMIRVAIGGVAMYAASRIDYHVWSKWPIPLLIAVFVFLLLLVLSLSGSGEEGAARWFHLGDLGNSLQPSELAKPAMVVYLAAWLSTKGAKLRSMATGLVPFSLLLGVMAGLVVAQPDLSTGAVIAVTALAMFYIAGADLKQFFGLILVAGASASGLLYYTAYRSKRVIDWLASLTGDDSTMRLGEQAYECTTALRSGGIFGVGLGGSQHKAAFGNMVHTDLIMAVAGEELGLFGSFLILGLFLLLAYRGVQISREAPDQFGCLLAVGIATWITIQAMVHAGVVAEVIPVTGMPLPFISFGGSALVVEMGAIGILLNISKQGVREGSIRGALFASGGRNRRPRLSAAHRR